MSDEIQDPPRGSEGSRRLSRRQLLALAGAGGAAATTGYLVVRGRPDAAPQSAAPTPTGHDHHASPTNTPAPTSQPPVPTPDGLPTARWSDPATWGGSVPDEGEVAVVEQPILLDVDAAVAGVRVEPSGTLVFDPTSSRTLRSTGNVVVGGVLQAQPGAHHVIHLIEFLDVDESRFEGGHTETPFDTDVGIWVVGGGLLDLHGTAKTAWTNLTGAARAGDATIEVDDATGWQVGDEVVVTPTEPATAADHWLHHDRRTITAVDRRRVTLDQTLQYPHPTVTVRPGVTHRAEVLNLTRNVVVKGTPDGRSHLVFNATTRAQRMGYVGLQHMGPRQGEEEVLGRYALHFHADYDGSRGSVVEGVVAYDSTGHGFAAHLSNGVTFRDCIAHDMVDDAFWWDLSLEGGRNLVPSHDIVYERCVAHFVKSGGNSRFNLTGFMMGAGEGNIARDCVSTGVQGQAESSAGFHWPSHSRDQNTWTFEDNIAHNNRHSGIYFWQNGAPRTIVTGFTAYQCGQGIFAGSYQNLVSYRDCTIYACKKSGLIISALPSRRGRRTAETITYEGMYIDQAGLSDYAVEISKHLSKGFEGGVTLIRDGTFMGGNRAQVAIPKGGDNLQLYDFVDCEFEGNAFWLADDVPADTALRVLSGDGGSYVVRRADQRGEPRPEWNATVSSA
ncbi:MAG: G8 domain-containing protein [Jiangellaceae bacterium]